MAREGDGTPSRLGTYALLALGMATFGSGTPVSKLVTDAFPVFLASGIRMLLAAAALLPLMVLEVRRAPGPERWLPAMTRSDWIRIGAIAVVGMFLFSVFMLYGMKEVSGATGSVIMATTPAITALGSILFLRDKLDVWKAAAIGLAVGGVLAVNLGSSSSGGGGDAVLGSALVFGAVCGEATYTVLGKRVTSDLTTVSVAAISALMATILFVPLALSQLDAVDTQAIDLTDWLALAWWGLGTMALGSVLWYLGVSRAAGITASAFMGVMPISALLLSYALLGESFEPIHLVGMAAVLAAIIAVTRSEQKAG